MGRRERKKRRSWRSRFLLLLLWLAVLSYPVVRFDSGHADLVWQMWGIIGMFLLTIFVIWRLAKLLKEIAYLHSPLAKIDAMTGEEFEEYLKLHFEKSFGYRCSLTPHSNDYGADLIMQKKKEKIAVQAKRYSGNVGIAAVQEVIAACSYYGCDRGIVVTNSYFTLQAERLAGESAIPVELWNRDVLRKNFKLR